MLGKMMCGDGDDEMVLLRDWKTMSSRDNVEYRQTRNRGKSTVGETEQ